MEPNYSALGPGGLKELLHAGDKLGPDPSAAGGSAGSLLVEPRKRRKVAAQQLIDKRKQERYTNPAQLRQSSHSSKEAQKYRRKQLKEAFSYKGKTSH